MKQTKHMKSLRQLYQLTEYEPVLIAQADLSEEVGYALWRQFDDQRAVLQLQFPSPKTEQQWQIIPNGWVGFIQATPQLQLQLNPRFPVAHIFKLWAYAYGFEQSPLLDALTQVEQMAQFPLMLAGWLARAALGCRKHGIAKAYVEESGALPYVRGRLVRVVPEKTAVFCHHHILTTNIPDNQIIAYTLLRLSRSGLLDGETQTAVRHATHLFSQIAEPVPIGAAGCYGRFYSRQTQHYEQIHQLCGFFLEQLSPVHNAGAAPFPAFLIQMPRLFERFVARWLQQHLPSPWRLAVQESVAVGAEDELQFRIDMVLYDGAGTAVSVLDTKYKQGAKLAAGDVQQLVTYAKLKRCQQAILIYPATDDQAQPIVVDDIVLTSVPFNLDKPIEQAGERLLAAILDQSAL